MGGGVSLACLLTWPHALIACLLFSSFHTLSAWTARIYTPLWRSAPFTCGELCRLSEPAAVSDLIKAQQSAFHNTHHHFSSDVTCNAAAVHQGSLPCGKLPAGLCESLTWGGLKPRDRPPVFAACVMRPQTAQRTGPPHTGASKHDQPNQNWKFFWQAASC